MMKIIIKNDIRGSLKKLGAFQTNRILDTRVRHRGPAIPECELNFSFVVSKGMGIRASQPDFFGGVL